MTRRPARRRSTGSPHRESAFHTRKTTSAPTSQPKDAPPGRSAIPRNRLWAFRITAAFLSCLLLLGLLELSLRLISYGHPTRAIVRYRRDAFDRHVDNAKFSWRFFHRNLAREFEPFTIPSKGSNTYRIFVCGASAAQGIPDGSYSFARILETMLRHCCPDVSVEVINTGMTAINSHVVLPIVRDCARHDPDLFVVYLGNNEVVGPYGPGTVFAGMAANLALIRAPIALKAARTGQLINHIGAAIRSQEDEMLTWGGMQMFLDKQVRLADAAMPTVYSHFQKNLQDIRDTALGARASIILCTVASNLRDCPPFASLHRENLTAAQQKQWRRVYDEGVALEEAGEFAAAVERYSAAAAIDNTFADLNFRLAQCYWTLGLFEKAREQYILAREHDTLRFRADDRINNIIRSTASTGRNRVMLVDFEQILEGIAPKTVTGGEHFYEHVHLNFTGNYLLALSLFEQITPCIAKKFSTTTPEVAPPTESECARYLAYTQWDQYRLAEKVLTDFLSNPPFTNQLYHEAKIAAHQAVVDTLKSSVELKSLHESREEYLLAISNNPDDWNLRYKLGRLLTEELKDYAAAARQFAAVQRIVPHFHRGYTAMGKVLAAQEKTNAAVDQYMEALRRYPASHDACYHLAAAYAGLKEFAQAERWFSKTIELQPTYGVAYNKLAEMLNRQGKIDEAIAVCRRGLAVSPNDAMLHGNLGIMLNKKGLKQEAIRELQTALNLEPDSANIRRVLQLIEKSPD